MANGDDNQSYTEWLEDLLANPAAGGAKGCFLYLVAAPTLIVCGVAGLAVLPDVELPKIVIIAPGLLLGGVILVIYGYIVYRLPAFFAILLSLLTGAVAYILAWEFGRQIFGMFRQAI